MYFKGYHPPAIRDPAPVTSATSPVKSNALGGAILAHNYHLNYLTGIPATFGATLCHQRLHTKRYTVGLGKEEQYYLYRNRNYEVVLYIDIYLPIDRKI
jgi:hypothetical protein